MRSTLQAPPRIHLDLYADDQTAEVERLIGLGATEIHSDKRPPDADYVILADPEAIASASSTPADDGLREGHRCDHAVRERPGGCAAFYGDVLGRRLIFEDDDLAAFDFGAVIVNLLRIGAAGELVEPAPVAAPEGTVRCLLTIDVDDVDAACERLVERGVVLLNGPIDRPRACAQPPSATAPATPGARRATLPPLAGGPTHPVGLMERSPRSTRRPGTRPTSG